MNKKKKKDCPETSHQAAREIGALQAAQSKLEKQVEELTWRLQLEKCMRLEKRMRVTKMMSSSNWELRRTSVREKRRPRSHLQNLWLVPEHLDNATGEDYLKDVVGKTRHAWMVGVDWKREIWRCGC